MGDSTRFHQNKIMCILLLLIAEGKHNRQIAGFYDSYQDFNNHGHSHLTLSFFALRLVKERVLYLIPTYKIYI